jgi:hypothetical protein
MSESEYEILEESKNDSLIEPEKQDEKNNDSPSEKKKW